ncbi:MAG TPA: GTPase ObgE [bacterium]|nr:GTPase ObgE [bacterium]HPN33850.1 GTPase ObgE [bacterium]
MFIDRAEIHVKAGNGGSGCIAFRREKYVPKGGPAGGDGGHGGDVVVVADEHVRTLLDFKYKNKYSAQNGRHGQGDLKTGKSGQSLTLHLPVGTLILDKESEEILVDLTRAGQTAVVARGGRGGRGNARFTSSTNRTPRQYEDGQEGEERTLTLELKLLADVGLVGLPNAGKSTLLSCISAARPKIADYAFTTLQPNLGIVQYQDGRSFVVADIPGLIEGAHTGRGLGIQFLRHIERTRVLAILIEATSEDPRGDFKMLLNELAAYKKELQKKPRVIVFTKKDLLTKRFRPPRLSRGDPHVVISAVAGLHLDELVRILWERLQKTS